jgi:hypothetical protein
MTTGATQALYDSDRIVFTRDGDGRAYYQYSNWSERPARRILTLTETRLARGGSFKAVAQTLAGVRGDLVMSLRLDELIHDVSRPPGTVRTTLTAELVDWRTRALAARPWGIGWLRRGLRRGLSRRQRRPRLALGLDGLLQLLGDDAGMFHFHAGFQRTTRCGLDLCPVGSSE